MKRLAELADSVRQVRPGRMLVLVGWRTERGFLAGSLAQELQLYRLDLGAVVSRYVGETEKNLAQVLARADNPGSVLFFDDADSLFGRRTGLTATHDREADLLRRLRWARGVVVLGVDRPERLPRELREYARVVAVREYWPPR